MSRSRLVIQLSTLRSVLFIGAVIAALGCQAEPVNPVSARPSASIDHRGTAPATAPAFAAPHDEAGASDEAKRLSDQAQRDVEELARLRNQPKTPPITQSSAAPKISKSGEPAPPQQILWNSPADRQAASAEKGASSKPAQPPDPTSAVAGASPQNLKPPTTDRPDAAAAPAGQTKVDRLAGLIVDLSGELYREAAYSDKPLRELLVIAATTMLNPDGRSVVVDPAAIPDLSDRQRELLGQLQTFFAELGRELDGVRDEQIVAAAVARLDKALARQPQLRLTNASLCWRVEGFSKFDPFNRNAFMAQTDQQVIVYVEIGDFTSQETSSGEWLTRLSQQLVIYNDSDGIPVWQEDWQPAVDRTKKKRNDFFLTQVITLPKALSVGKYQLKVRVRDDQSKAEAETSVEFEMVADQRLAASMH